MIFWIIIKKKKKLNEKNFFFKRFNEKKLKMLNEILKRYMAGAHAISHKVSAYIYIY